MVKAVCLMMWLCVWRTVVFVPTEDVTLGIRLRSQLSRLQVLIPEAEAEAIWPDFRYV